MFVLWLCDVDMALLKVTQKHGRQTQEGFVHAYKTIFY